MDYNSQRKKLPLPEYGRNIQKMVDYLLTIEDKEKRNKSAQAVIDVMGNLYPYLRDVAEFKHKLWDHLAIMTDFKLDIDYPYELPSPEILSEKPKQVPYNQNKIKFKHYGLIMEKMIKKAPELVGEEKEILTEMLANHMKKSYLAWNKDAVEDKKIFMDLAVLSEGKIKVDEKLQLTETKNLLNKQKKKKNTQNKSNKRY
ncbi:MAG: DUF4290 domain-containing protein [Prolixibacteraceae bacterium]|jgi:hypothetical protein|nr:DUF4290 domain-containing protein [Prolixibacteraceae bacterium]MBT6007214.1 DUF4290 domain-containing protein [Prolixibacteraceae bacterium]MBT6764537.1 DUF4290 domain-containing protein [Prolixibacteraceae bacterium]MBT6999953.1 DUF4290 domain-containing protein [Prolixibacteraceae bacterium]MBT7396273.1 DUF4290 domain-containing protein [Prolixibacteraceae bacterium]